MTTEKKSSDRVQTVQSLTKGISIFDFVLSAGLPVRITDVAEHFDIDKSVAYRFLTTLERSGLLVKDPEYRSYTVGSLLHAWSRKVGDSQTQLLTRLKPLVERLASDAGQTAHIAVLNSDRVVLIEVSAADTLIGIRQKVGDWEPLYSSAVGKAILAWLPESERDALIENIRFVRHTANTLTTRKALRAELADARRDGVAFDRCEGNEEVCCIAAPILKSDGGVVASVGISMPRRMVEGGPDQQLDAIGLVRTAAITANRMLFVP